MLVEEFSEKCFDSVKFLVVVLDKDQLIGYINLYGCTLLGYETTTDLIGKNWFDTCVYPTEKDFLEFVFKELGTVSTIMQELNELPLKDIFGNKIFVSWRYTLLLNSEGIVSKILFVGEDITTKKIIEEEFNKTLFDLDSLREEINIKNREKDEFLHLISHELRTPLNGIIGFINLLNLENLTLQQKEFVNYVQESSNRLKTLVAGILAIANSDRQLTVTYIDFNLKDLLHIINIEYKQEALEKGLFFEITVEDTVPVTIHTDKLRFAQILGNLIDNALKYTSRGFVKVYISFMNDKLICEVSDSGIGIDRKDYERIFDAFTTLENKDSLSTGLGLSICKKLLHLLGGNITVKSVLGKGSSFTFVLPVTSLVKESEVSLIAPDSLSLVSETFIVKKYINKKVVLIVEDNYMSYRLSGILLERKGLETIHVSNGQSALDLLEIKHVDLILMDMKMPYVDGFTATKIIKSKEHLKSIPIIAVTAYASEEDKVHCMEVGCDEYISKPINYEDFSLLIDKFLDN